MQITFRVGRLQDWVDSGPLRMFLILGGYGGSGLYFRLAGWQFERRGDVIVRLRLGQGETGKYMAAHLIAAQRGNSVLRDLAQADHPARLIVPAFRVNRLGPFFLHLEQVGLGIIHQIAERAVVCRSNRLFDGNEFLEKDVVTHDKGPLNFYREIASLP